MSHVLDPRSVKDRDRIKIKHIGAFMLACQRLGLQVLTDVAEQQYRGVAEPKPGRGQYRGHKTHYGRLVGDYPIPQGWTYEDVDNNAHLVARMPKETFDRLKGEGKIADWITFDRMYDLGLVWDEADRCFYPVYDFADGGGVAMQQVLGEVARDYSAGAGVSSAYSKLMQMYHACCDQLTAQEQELEIEFEPQPDGSIVSYVLLKE